MAANVSLKQIQINRANTTMVAATAAAAFVFTFAVISGRALLSKRAYQGRVIAAKEKAVKQLQANIKATDTLQTSYKAFVSTPDNVIGGNPAGTGDRDGDNAKITLDALPAQYDFPALASSVEKILGTNNYKISSIVGTDDEVAQSGNASSPTPQPVAMPFQFGVATDLNGAKNLFSILDRSIRPIQVQTLDLAAGSSQLNVTITAQTFYQPAKSLKIETKVVQ